MNDADFADLLASIREGGEILAGRQKPSRVTVINPPDIKKIRKEMNVSQDRFAAMIGVSPRTLQNWEQGRRKPVGPAHVLLRIAEKDPKAIVNALRP